MKLNVENVTAIIEGAAVLVALYANHQTKKELKQAKNIEFFDKRVEILNMIENDEDVSENTVKLLFSNSEYQKIQLLNKYKAKKKQASDDEKTFRMLSYEKYNDGELNEDVYLKIRDYHQKQSREDTSINTNAEYKKYCGNNVLTEPNTGDVYNFYDIEMSYTNAVKEIEQYKNELIDSMKNFIEKSIKVGR